VIPLFENHDVKLQRILTDRGSEYCGNPERPEYELYHYFGTFRRAGGPCWIPKSVFQ